MMALDRSCHRVYSGNTFCDLHKEAKGADRLCGHDEEARKLKAQSDGAQAIERRRGHAFFLCELRDHKQVTERGK